MAIAQLEYPRFRAFDSAGKPLSGGKVYVYEAGTTTKTTIWSDADQSGTLSNPVTLDSNGEKEIWFEGNVKIVLEDKDGNQQWTIDDIQSDVPPSDVGRFNQIENGSFEIDSNGDGLPDSWTITEFDDTSTVEIDTTDVNHGANSLKFISQGDGGGTATTQDFFAVNAGRPIVVAFTLQSSVADVTNSVQVRWYDKDQTFVSSSTVYNESASNPTSFEEKRFASTAPSTATYAKVRLTGCDSSDSTPGTTFFDDIKVFTDAQALVYSSGNSVVKNLIEAGTEGVSFPNVDSNVTSSDEELNKLAGRGDDIDAIAGHSSTLNTILDNYDEQTVELGGDFDAGESVKCLRIGSLVCITSIANTGSFVSHTTDSAAFSSTGVVPSNFRPTQDVHNVLVRDTSQIYEVELDTAGTIVVSYRDYTGSQTNFSQSPINLTFVIT